MKFIHGSRNVRMYVLMFVCMYVVNPPTWSLIQVLTGPAVEQLRWPKPTRCR